MFLTPEEVVALTGYQRWSAQRRWLTQRGYRHDVLGSGRPVVLRAEVERHLLGGSGPKERSTGGWSGPKLDQLRRPA